MKSHIPAHSLKNLYMASSSCTVGWLPGEPCMHLDLPVHHKGEIQCHEAEEIAPSLLQHSVSISSPGSPTISLTLFTNDPTGLVHAPLASEPGSDLAPEGE